MGGVALLLARVNPAVFLLSRAAAGSHEFWRTRRAGNKPIEVRVSAIGPLYVIRNHLGAADPSAGHADFQDVVFIE
jgi:hypothetical protein